MSGKQLRQPLDGTRYARKVREERSEILTDLRRGTRSIRDILEGSAPSCVQHMDVYDVVCAVKGVGRERCRTIFERAQVWPHIEVCELSTAQREGILLNLP